MDRIDTLPELPESDDRDQFVVLTGISWSQYESLDRTRRGKRRPRLAYLDGALEIMTTSSRHEIVKTLTARLVETFAEERDVSLNGLGSTTFRKKLSKAGLEPDECYAIGEVQEFPDLAIEIVYTSGGVSKLEIYRRLRVAEVWFWIDGRFWVYQLTSDRYQLTRESSLLPGIDLAEIATIVTTTDNARQTEAIRTYRASLRRTRRRRT